MLRAVAKDGPLGMVHFDSHTDLFHSYFNGQMYTHGTPFRRAVEEGLLDPKRVVQIGLRGTMYDSEDRDFARAEGIRLILIEEFFERGVADVMAEAREIVGVNRPISRMTSISSIRPLRPAPARPRWAGQTRTRRCRSAGNLRASISWARTWSKCRRHSMPAGTRPFWECRSCLRSCA